MLVLETMELTYKQPGKVQICNKKQLCEKNLESEEKDGRTESGDLGEGKRYEDIGGECGQIGR